MGWPTTADKYELIDRIGQGAFASVWRARIAGRRPRTTAADDEGADDERGAAGEGDCAIKIMDLEHVNVNIGGEFPFERQGGR